jgi:UDP-N-acetylglucosamine 2-epimerase (non-hydrolysing)
MREKINSQKIIISGAVQDVIHAARRQQQQVVLVTTHRRESFHGGTQRILETVKYFACNNPDVLFIYPHHPNPHIIELIKTLDMGSCHNIVLSGPLEYQELVYILEYADWVATDSGGIQEEALSLGKQVIVLRENTERPEGIVHGLSTLVGTDTTKITTAFECAKKNAALMRTQPLQQIYGDGYAAEKIVGIIQEKVYRKQEESHEPHMHHGPGLHRPSHSNRSC